MLMTTAAPTFPRSRSSINWWLVIGLTLLLNLPILIGLVMTPRGYSFFGNSSLAPGDAAVYYSYIEQGRAGKLIMNDVFTSEPHRASIWEPLWGIIGWMAERTNVTTSLAYALTRVVADGLLILTILWAAGKIFAARTFRRWWWLVVLAGGVGGITDMISNQGAYLLTTPPDLWVSEAYVYLTGVASPHFALVTSGTIFVLVSMVAPIISRRRAAAVGLAAVATLMIHPFHIITWGIAWSALILWRRISEHRWPKKLITRGVALLLVIIPIIIGYAQQLIGDPITWLRAGQNINSSPSIGTLLIGLGALLPLAIYGAIRWRGEARYRQLLVVWAGAILIAAYLPLPFQRRLLQGLSVPLALLSIMGVEIIYAALKKPPISPAVRRIVIGGIIIILCSSWPRAFGNVVRAYDKSRRATLSAYYLDATEQELISAVKSLPSRQAILAAKFHGNVLAGLTAHPVFIGHTVETLHFSQKERELADFYSTYPQDEQRALLARYQLCYIIDSPWESFYGSVFQPSTWPDLKIIWQSGTTTIYQTPYCRP